MFFPQVISERDEPAVFILNNAYNERCVMTRGGKKLILFRSRDDNISSVDQCGHRGDLYPVCCLKPPVSLQNPPVLLMQSGKVPRLPALSSKTEGSYFVVSCEKVRGKKFALGRFWNLDCAEIRTYTTCIHYDTHHRKRCTASMFARILVRATSTT